MMTPLKEEIERLKQENGILKRCLKHEQELTRKLHERIDELSFSGRGESNKTETKTA